MLRRQSFRTNIENPRRSRGTQRFTTTLDGRHAFIHRTPRRSVTEEKSQQEESCILKITHTQRAGLQRAAAGNAAGASKQDALQLLQQATARFRDDITATACLNISTSVLQLLTPSAFHLRVADLLTATCLQVASFTLERH